LDDNTKQEQMDMVWEKKQKKTALINWKEKLQIQHLCATDHES